MMNNPVVKSHIVIGTRFLHVHPEFARSWSDIADKLECSMVPTKSIAAGAIVELEKQLEEQKTAIHQTEQARKSAEMYGHTLELSNGVLHKRVDTLQAQLDEANALIAESAAAAEAALSPSKFINDVDDIFLRELNKFETSTQAAQQSLVQKVHLVTVGN